MSFAAKHLSCSYGEHSLFSNLSFKVDIGSMLQIEGKNGSGKTTLLRILAGLKWPGEGEVLWEGKPIRKQRAAYNGSLAFLGHQCGVKAGLTPLENIRLVQSLSMQSSDISPEEALIQLGLEDYKNQCCSILSAGQQRRVAIAQLLVQGSNIWLLDEPFTSIDKESIEVLKSLMKVHIERGGIIIFSSHHDVIMDNEQHMVVNLDAL